MAFGWGIQPTFPDYTMREPEEILPSHFPPIHPSPAVLSGRLNPNGTQRAKNPVDTVYKALPPRVQSRMGNILEEE